MENKNKCFFSISLENGITITGENPRKVLNFLYDVHSGFYELGGQYINQGYPKLAEEIFEKMTQINNATKTIHDNYYNK